MSSSAQSVMESFRRIVQALRISSRQAESLVGLSGAQLFVLQKLHESEHPVTMSDLAQLTLTHISSVSVVVSRLAERGLLRKYPSPQDGRRMQVALSDQGREMLKNPPRTAQADLIAAVGQLPDWEQTLLSSILEKIIKEAGFIGIETNMFFESGSDQP